MKKGTVRSLFSCPCIFRCLIEKKTCFSAESRRCAAAELQVLRVYCEKSAISSTSRPFSVARTGRAGSSPERAVAVPDGARKKQEA